MISFSTLIRTDQKLNNTPPSELVPSIVATGVWFEEEVMRAQGLAGRQFIITRCYSTPEVNRAVGGSVTSAHVKGLAVDFKVPGMSPRDVVAAIRKSGVKFDQLILEPTWVHIGRGPRMRGQVLEKTKDGYKVI